MAMTDQTPAAQTSEPRTADCFHRLVHGLTNWVDDGKGNTVADGCYWYCYDCGAPFRPVGDGSNYTAEGEPW